MSIAVLDVGKTNVKLALFEGTALVWQRSAPNPVLPGPPYPHADVEAIWRFLIASLHQAAAEHAIETLVVTTHGATVALVGEQALALPVMDYEFAGVDAIEPEYAGLRPPYAETFSPMLSGGLNYGRQIFYLQRRFPEAFAETRHIVPYAQYFGWRLTGVSVGELTFFGSHSDIWQPSLGGYSSLVERLGWSPLLPPVRPANAVLGRLLPAIVAATGLDPETRLLVGIHDSNASLLPHLLAFTPPFTVISSGTWVVILAVGASTGRLDPNRDMLAYVNIDGHAVPAAKFMGGREFSALLDGAEAEATEADLDAVLASGALAIPSFAPQGGPFSDHRGRILGTLPDRAGARAALASLYTALMTDLMLTALGADHGILALEGNAARNPIYCGVLAALRPAQPVKLAADAAGTAFGASLLANWPHLAARPSLGTAGAYPDREGLLRYRQAWREALPGWRPYAH